LISSLVSSVIDFYLFIVFAYVIMSWFRPSGFLYDVYAMLATICEPYIGLFRRIVPQGGGGIDFSPLVAILVLQVIVQPVLRSLLLNLGL
jgi:YggT family protein